MIDPIPKHWKISTLGSVAKWGSGGTPNRSIAEYYGGSIPWFKTGELNDGIVTDSEEFLTEEGVRNSSAKIFPKGSVMLAMYGATIGKCAVLGIDGTTNQACAVAQPHDFIEPRYLFHYLRSQKQNFVDKGKGGAQPNISQTVIKEHPIPLPPLPEQKLIVAKLDKLFAHLDQLKVRLEKIPDLLKQFRLAVLTQAVTGKLTEEWRGSNECEPIAKDILKLKPNAEYQLSEIENWLDIKLQFITERVSVGHVGPTSQYYTDETEGIPFLRSQNVRPGYIDLENVEFITREFHQRLKKSQLKAGDLLIVRVGANRGDSAILPKGLGEVNCANIVLARPYENLSEYLGIFFTSPQWTNKVDELTTGTAQGVINTSIVALTEVPVPPFKEQKEIVSRVESLFAMADRIETSYELLKEKIDQLPQAILSKAFQGQLPIN